jgi:hypothetical protein
VWIALIVGFLLLGLGAILLWSGRKTQKLVNVMTQAVPTPANKVADAFPGEMVSITGEARSSHPLVSEQAQIPCLYYSCSVERDYETTEHVAATKNRPARTETRRVTETVSSNTQSTSFFIEDATGQAHVIPDDAEFDAREVHNRFESANNSGGGSFSIGGLSIGLGNGNRTIGYRYRESIIPTDAQVYVVGVVNEAGEIGKPMPKQENAALIVSYRTQDALLEDWQDSARWWAYGSIGSATAGIALLVVAAALAIL